MGIGGGSVGEVAGREGEDGEEDGSVLAVGRGSADGPSREPTKRRTRREDWDGSDMEERDAEA